MGSWASPVSAPGVTAAIRMSPFSHEHIGAVQAFNRRLAAGRVRYRFPEHPCSTWLPRCEGRHIFQEYYLALDQSDAVRGGYILKRQEFAIHGRPRRLAFYHLPLSEGLIDRRHGAIGVRLLLDALAREPLLFVLGIGSEDEPLSRMLTAMSWRLEAVPFLFRILRPYRVARGLAYARSTWWRRLVLDGAAISGAAWVGSAVAGARARGGSPSPPATKHAHFDEWADVLWDACRHDYSFIGRRDRETLDILYPPGDARFIRLAVDADGGRVGWVVVLATDMRGHKHFGDLRVGSIVDCLAPPSKAATVVGAAVRHLNELGVDLIVSNQLSDAWVRGLQQHGFLPGPSTFLFGASRALRALLHGGHGGERHVNRGDGDGPINL